MIAGHFCSDSIRSNWFLCFCVCGACTCVYFQWFSLLFFVGLKPSKFVKFFVSMAVWRRSRRRILWIEITLISCFQVNIVAPWIMGVAQTKEQPRAGMALNIEQLRRLSFWRGELKYSKKQQTVWKKKYFLLLRKVWISVWFKWVLLGRSNM